MNTPYQLEARIAGLAAQVDEGLRRELQGALATLRDADQPINVILALSRLSLLLLDQIFAAVDEVRPSDNLWNCILRVSSGNEKNPQIQGLGILPRTLKENLDTIRKWSNPADHADHRVPAPTLSDAENALGMFLRVVEWFYCEFEKGPRLPTVYTEAWRPVTLHQRFAELQDASAEQSRSLQAEIALLHETLRRQSERAQETTRDPVPIPLPTLRGTFVDREVERDTLHHLLREGDMRLVVIVAPGGYGKTELTTKILKEVAPTTSIIDPNVHGILYLRCLRGDLSLGRIFAEAGRIVGARESFQQTYASRDLTLERKLEFFFGELSQGGNVWVVMDNFEDLLAADDTIVDAELRAFVEAVVAMNHKLRLIMTTRAAPKFSGSQHIKAIDLRDGLPEDEAVKYLRTDGINCGLQEADEELVRNFVSRVHRIPKALESVIGYLLDKYPVVRLADLMANDELFADFDRYDSENGLKHLISQQFNDQTSDAQLVLCALSIFTKPSSVAALRYLIPALDWASVLPRLERNRLINRQGDRYDLHPLIRERAYARIPANAAAESVGGLADVDRECNGQSKDQTQTATSVFGTRFSRRDLHGRAADLFRELQPARAEWKTLDDLEPYLDEFYHRVRAGQYDEACLLFNGIESDFLSLWGSYARIVELRSELAAHLTDPVRRLENCGKLGHAWHYLGDAARARTCYEKALAIAQEVGNRKQESVWLGALGETYDLDQAEESIELHTRALEIAREIQDRETEADHLSNLGLIYDWMGDAQKAITFFSDALEIARQMNDRENVGVQLGYLGIAYQDFRDIPRAIEHYQSALEIADEISDHTSKAVHLCNLGHAYRTIGMMGEAITCHQESLRISRKIGYHLGEGRDPECLGLTYQALGDLEKAMAYYEEALALDTETDDKWGQGMDLEHMGRACFEMGDNQKARQFLEKALSLGIEVNVIEDQYEALVGLGIVCHSEGKLLEARGHYQDALKFELPKSHYSCESLLGILCLAQGATTEAHQHLSRGIAMCQKLLSRTPNLYDALYLLALAQLASGLWTDAIATYRQALEVCSAKGVVRSALREIALLKSLPEPVAEVARAEALLQAAIGKTGC